MSFREREEREKRDHRSSYIGIRNGFGKGWGAEAKFENIIVGRRDVLSRHKGAEEGRRLQEVGRGRSVHFIGRYFHGVGTRARGQRHECLMERVGSVGSSGVASLSDISRDNVARRSNKRFTPMEAPLERGKDRANK